MIRYDPVKIREIDVSFSVISHLKIKIIPKLIIIPSFQLYTYIYPNNIKIIKIIKIILIKLIN